MKALRHQAGKEPQVFEVLRKNDDGTVDLGLNGQLVIGSCVVSDDAKPGTCTLIADSAGAKAKADAEAKAKADAEAAKKPPPK